MRLVIVLVAASVVGSVLTSGVRTFFGESRNAPSKEMARLYKDDPKGMRALIANASLDCAPELRRVRSGAARDLITDAIVLAIDSSRPFGDNASEDVKRQRVNNAVASALNGASKTDIAALDGFIQHSDMPEVLRCIAGKAVKMSRQAVERPGQLLENVEFRR